MSRHILKKTASILTSDAKTLRGELSVPDRPQGLVVFCDVAEGGIGDIRNQRMISRLWEQGLGTFVVELYSSSEGEAIHGGVFDLDRTVQRLIQVTDWVEDELTDDIEMPPIGYIGRGAGAAVALATAARQVQRVEAVVCIESNLHLVEDLLPYLIAPTLLVVREDDPLAVHWNEECLELIAGAKELIRLSGNRFEEAAGQAAAEWFGIHLREEETDEPHPETSLYQ